jgi:heme-degrading monooxygenase HmoA
MIVVTNRLYVNPEHAAEFEKRFLQRSGLIDSMPGFVRNQVLRPVTEEAPYVVLTMWESKEHFDAWTQSESFKKAHTSGGGHASSGGGHASQVYTAPNHVEIFEVLSDSEQAPAS